MRDVAEAVGIRGASLYHHFASKEEILYAICLTVTEEPNEQNLPLLDAPGTPTERLAALVRGAPAPPAPPARRARRRAARAGRAHPGAPRRRRRAPPLLPAPGPRRDRRRDAHRRVRGAGRRGWPRSRCATCSTASATGSTTTAGWRWRTWWSATWTSSSGGCSARAGGGAGPRTDLIGVLAEVVGSSQAFQLVRRRQKVCEDAVTTLSGMTWSGRRADATGLRRRKRRIRCARGDQTRAGSAGLHGGEERRPLQLGVDGHAGWTVRAG